jgi:hypothetical protein
MRTLTLPVSDDYLYHISVTDVPAIQAKHIAITSQWLGAKHPDERQTQFTTTLTHDQIRALANHLLENLQ